jgi:hypothetical protein
VSEPHRPYASDLAERVCAADAARLVRAALAIHRRAGRHDAVDGGRDGERVQTDWQARERRIRGAGRLRDAARVVELDEPPGPARVPVVSTPNCTVASRRPLGSRAKLCGCRRPRTESARPEKRGRAVGGVELEELAAHEATAEEVPPRGEGLLDMVRIVWRAPIGTVATTRP